MSANLTDFRPAQYFHGKECYVGYYVVNPFTKKMVRKKIKLNHIISAKERKRYGQRLAFEINTKLYDGWNPFVDESSSSSKVILKAVECFLSEKEKTLRKDSMRSYRSFSKMFLEWCDSTNMSSCYCFEFDKIHAERLMFSIENKGVSNKSYNNYRVFFTTLFLYFKEKGWTNVNPFASIKHKREDLKVRNTIPPEERKRIVDYFVQHDMYGYVVMMMMCYQCLIRPKEMLMLRIRDIDPVSWIIKIDSSIAKNHKRRDIAIPDSLIPYYTSIIDKDEHFYIFSEKYMPGGRMLTSRDSGRTWSKMRDELGLPKEYQFYSLKDTGITEMLEAGVAPKYVKELADHHSLEMTEKYTHKSNAVKIKNATKIEF